MVTISERVNMTREQNLELIRELGGMSFLNTRSINGLLIYLSEPGRSIKSMTVQYLSNPYGFQAELLRTPGFGARSYSQVRNFIKSLIEEDAVDIRHSLEALVDGQFIFRRHGSDYVLELAGEPYLRIVNGRSVYDANGNFFKEAV